MKKPYPRPYVGIVKGTHEYVRFWSKTNPTEETHGERFVATIGPFRTVAAAELMKKYGKGNPHMQHVSDCERLAKRGLK